MKNTIIAAITAIVLLVNSLPAFASESFESRPLWSRDVTEIESKSCQVYASVYPSDSSPRFLYRCQDGSAFWSTVEYFATRP